MNMKIHVDLRGSSTSIGTEHRSETPEHRSKNVYQDAERSGESERGVAQWRGVEHRSIGAHDFSTRAAEQSGAEQNCSCRRAVPKCV